MLQLWNYKDYTLTQEVDKVIQEFGKTYEGAVYTINVLKRRYESYVYYYTDRTVPNMRRYLQRIGYKVSDLNRLNIIHITGTKGKGSTSSYCENILRQYGYKTGMLSSPHFMSMTERIVLQGKPVDKDVFARHFWTICDKLMDSRESDDDVPGWSHFNTLLGFDIFMSSGTNALVMEVGMGGECDSTNVIEASVACGVTSLELDHTEQLGKTLESIAWHKSGIFKRGSHALSVPQKPSVIKVLQERAAEKGAMFSVVPILDDKSNCDKPIKLGISGEVQIKNASLAVQLCRKWLETCHPGFSLNSETSGITGADGDIQINQLPSFQLTQEMLHDELATTHLPGRTQIVRHPGVTYYLDGAHTVNSITCCGEWFATESEKEKDALKLKTARILIFSGALNDRDPLRQLTILKKSAHLDAAVFVPKQENCSKDQLYYNETTAEAKKTMQGFADVWNDSDSAESTEVSKGGKESQSKKAVVSNDRVSMCFPTFKEGLVAASLGRCAKVLESREQEKTSEDVRASNSVQEGLKSSDPRQYDEYLSSLNLPERFRDFDHVQILATGSFKCASLAAWYLGVDAF